MLKTYEEAIKGITKEAFFDKVFSEEIKTYGDFNKPVNPILDKVERIYRSIYNPEPGDPNNAAVHFKDKAFFDKGKYDKWKEEPPVIDGDKSDIIIKRVKEETLEPVRDDKGRIVGSREIPAEYKETTQGDIHKELVKSRNIYLTKLKNVYTALEDIIHKPQLRSWSNLKAILDKTTVDDTFYHPFGPSPYGWGWDAEEFFDESIETLKNYLFDEPSEEAPEQPDNEQKRPVIIFRQDKGATGWTIGMKGNTGSYSHKDGFLYIRCLLESPNKEIDCSDLFNLKQRVKGSTGKRYNPGMNPEPSTQEKDNAENNSEDDNEIGYDDAKVSNRPCELATPETVAACKARLKKLTSTRAILLEKEEPEKGKHRSPKEEQDLELIEDEIGEIAKYLREVTDKSGNIRNSKDDNYRRRETVTASINRALRELNSLSDLLNDDTIETGYTCKYRPDSNNPPIIETR